MNSYERVMKCLRFEEPDRVPLAEFLIDRSVYTALLPEAREQYDFDLKAGFDVLSARAAYKTVSDDGTVFVDEWGITYHRNKEAVSHPVKGPLAETAGLGGFRVPDPDNPERLSNLPVLVKAHKKDRAIAFGLRAMFLWAANLRGLDNLLADLLLEPAFASDLLDTILEAQIRLARNAVRAGADIIIETDDYAFNNGPLMSPETFEEFITPRLSRIVQAVHAEGGYFLKHTDGNIMKIMPSFLKAGIDGLQSIDPIAGMDIGEMKEKYGKKISLWGNIDCGNLLKDGSREDVRAAVRDCIKRGAPGGGFVLMSSNSIPNSAKPENYAALLEAGREFGAYPIRL